MFFLNEEKQMVGREIRIEVGGVSLQEQRKGPALRRCTSQISQVWPEPLKEEEKIREGMARTWSEKDLAKEDKQYLGTRTHI